jgi:uncharacterized protein DUF4154
MTPDHCSNISDIHSFPRPLLVFLSLLLFTQLAFGYDNHKKSLFLKNITHLVSWPVNDKSDFSICVLNDKAFLNALQTVYTDKTFKQKPVVISSLTDNERASLCDVLFIGKKTDNIDQLTQTLLAKPTLTVSDTKAFKQKGVMIIMFNDDDRVACTINHKAAQLSDIHVSYLLLESAYEVIK